MSIRVKVPATSANLGPGFDCMGVALSLYNEYIFRYGEEGDDGDSLMARASRAVFDHLGETSPAVRIEVRADIPMARGLGSSAACVVAGCMAANAQTGNQLDTDTLLGIATEVEGHPDNVAPALLGGITLSLSDGGVRYHQFMPKNQLDFVALVPDYQLSTKDSRDVLPKTVPFHDAVANAAHSGFLALSLYLGRLDDLPFAMRDWLHQPYRMPLMPDYEDVVSALRELGEDIIYLSGAGPTIMCISRNGARLTEAWAQHPMAQQRRAYGLSVCGGAEIGVG